eukprot:scaffold164864_cov29-Tisochrysis_lutea.AAC.3
MRDRLERASKQANATPASELHMCGARTSDNKSISSRNWLGLSETSSRIIPCTGRAQCIWSALSMCPPPPLIAGARAGSFFTQAAACQSAGAGPARAMTSSALSIVPRRGAARQAHVATGLAWRVAGVPTWCPLLHVGQEPLQPKSLEPNSAGAHLASGLPWRLITVPADQVIAAVINVRAGSVGMNTDVNFTTLTSRSAALDLPPRLLAEALGLNLD